MKREFEVFNEHRVFELKLFAFQDNISGVSAVYEEICFQTDLPCLICASNSEQQVFSCMIFSGNKNTKNIHYYKSEMDMNSSNDLIHVWPTQNCNTTKACTWMLEQIWKKKQGLGSASVHSSSQHYSSQYLCPWESWLMFKMWIFGSKWQVLK